MGKSKGRNAFFYYMLHKQRQLKENGEDLGVNSPRLQQLAGDEWKSLSAEEREPFNRRAKSEKDKTKVDINPKNYNQRQEDFGRSLAKQSEELEDDEDREIYLDKLIECSIKACRSAEDLMNASFFVISSNVMIKTDSIPAEWYPMEIGICQYTIKKGILFTYHQFVDPGKVPMGYMARAKSWSEDKHKIPLDNFYGASNNYQKIVEDIAQILDSSRFTNEMTDKPTPMMVYCPEAQLEQNRGVFEWLAKAYRKVVPTFNWDLEVMDLVNLLYHVSNSVSQPIQPAIGDEYLTTSAFDYSAETRCDFHEEMDNMHCARGGARKYCYMMSQALCHLFDVQPTDKHLPQKRSNVIADAYEQELVEVKPIITNRYHSHRNVDDWEPTTSNEQTGEEPNSRPQSKVSGIGRGRGRGWGWAQN